MEREEIFEKVKEIVVDVLKVHDEDSVTEDAELVDDLDASSLDVVELVMALEDEFPVKIPDEDADKVKTVGDIVEYLAAHM